METRVDGRSLRYQHRRGELLDAVAAYVLETGVAALSLRRAAEAVGVSHVTLQHHFGSKEQLVDEIIECLLERIVQSQSVHIDDAPTRDADLPTRLRMVWAHLTSPGGQRDIRLFIEFVGQSLFGGARLSPPAARSIEQRLELITATIVGLGCPREEAGAFGTLLLATLRGLIMELLITGDRERMDAAFELAVADAERHTAQWASAGAGVQ
jgi:AcrR family transcriptional regulator